jgi:hypothetical protein
MLNMADEYAGYDSIEDLVKAYRSSSDEGKRQRQRADTAEAAARGLLEQQGQRSPQQRPDPASRLAEYGVPVDALDEYFNARFDRAFEPVAKGAMARNAMLSTHPDYQKYEAEVAQFINEDPNLSQSYQKLFGADPVAAMEFAFLKFGETKRRAAPGNGNGQPTPQQQARAEAQIPSSRVGDAQRQPAGVQDERLRASWEHYQKSGDPRAFAKERLRQVISDDFLAK